MIKNQENQKYDVKTMVQIAMLIALSLVGSTIKIQGSIAFDSMAAYFAALYISPLAGGLVGILGHLASAATAGFYMTIPMHLLVGAEMFAFVYVFGWAYRRTSNWTAIAIGTFLNGPIAALLAVPLSLFLGLPFGGWPLFSAIWIPLTIASFLNIFIALILYKNIKKGRKHEN